MDTMESRFVATLLHPVFATAYASREIRMVEDPDTGGMEAVRSFNVRGYLDMRPVMGVAVEEQEVPHVGVMFHTSRASFIERFTKLLSLVSFPLPASTCPPQTVSN